MMEEELKKYIALVRAYWNGEPVESPEETVNAHVLIMYAMLGLYPEGGDWDSWSQLLAAVSPLPEHTDEEDIHTTIVRITRMAPVLAYAALPAPLKDIVMEALIAYETEAEFWESVLISTDFDFLPCDDCGEEDCPLRITSEEKERPADELLDALFKPCQRREDSS